MAMIDLGNPYGFVVSGYGAEKIADDLGGQASGETPEVYAEWYEQTRSGQIAPECGARALEASTQLGGADDFGQLVARASGSGSI